jgi:hypothetical protein
LFLRFTDTHYSIVTLTAVHTLCSNPLQQVAIMVPPWPVAPKMFWNLHSYSIFRPPLLPAFLDLRETSFFFFCYPGPNQAGDKRFRTLIRVGRSAARPTWWASREGTSERPKKRRRRARREHDTCCLGSSDEASATAWSRRGIGMVWGGTRAADE